MGHPQFAEHIEFDDANEAHLARHGVTPTELQQVLDGDPLWAKNKNGMTAAWRMVGRTLGGRALVAAVMYDEARSSVRPITARSCTSAEVTRWSL